MPLKMKLHKEKGKLKSIPKATPSSSQNADPVPLESDSESRQQFEVELLWCIHQLQNALESGKLSQKQMQDSSKTLNTLMSNRTPLIKKRQLMRGTFGDYRTKMVQEEIKYARINSKIGLAPVKPSKKSVFVKKAPFLTSGKDFKFNFTQSKPLEQLDNTTETLAQLSLKEVSPDAIIEPVTVSETDSKRNDTNFELTESSQKRKTECVENNGTVQDRIEENGANNDEPPCKMFHYHKSKNEFRFNFTETTE